MSHSQTSFDHTVGSGSFPRSRTEPRSGNQNFYIHQTVRVQKFSDPSKRLSGSVLCVALHNQSLSLSMYLNNGCFVEEYHAVPASLYSFTRLSTLWFTIGSDKLLFSSFFTFLYLGKIDVTRSDIVCSGSIKIDAVCSSTFSISVETLRTLQTHRTQNTRNERLRSFSGKYLLQTLFCVFSHGR